MDQSSSVFLILDWGQKKVRRWSSEQRRGSGEVRRTRWMRKPVCPPLCCVSRMRGLAVDRRERLGEGQLKQTGRGCGEQTIQRGTCFCWIPEIRGLGCWDLLPSTRRHLDTVWAAARGWLPPEKRRLRSPYLVYFCTKFSPHRPPAVPRGYGERESSVRPPLVAAGRGARQEEA